MRKKNSEKESEEWRDSSHLINILRNWEWTSINTVLKY